MGELRLSKAARKLALEEKLGMLEVLVQAFSPKGIMGDLLAAAASKSLKKLISSWESFRTADIKSRSPQRLSRSNL